MEKFGHWMRGLAHRSRTNKFVAENRANTSDVRFERLPWYTYWLKRQLRRQIQLCRSTDLLRSLPNFELGEDSSWDTEFFPVWDSIKAQMEEAGPKTIESITATVTEHGLLNIAEDYTGYQSAKTLVFAIVGWQTMLYSPDVVASLGGSYCIEDETDGHRGEAHVCLMQSNQAGKRNLPEFLLGFGLMLPPSNYCAFNDIDEQKRFKQTKTVAPTDMDAYLLTRFCGVKFQWTDSLTCHLELDKSMKVLYVYRYPSFCLANLSHPLSTEGQQRTPIHSLVVTPTQSIKWATASDVTQLLEEIILSYRLLFGQTKRSRRLFHRETKPFAGIPVEGLDDILLALCGSKRLPSRCWVRGEASEYQLAEDFPHLRSRIVRLVSYVAETRSRSLRDLWLDKRDSASWMTFWTVLIIGSLGVLLSFIQTVFQVLQYVEALSERRS